MSVPNEHCEASPTDSGSPEILPPTDTAATVSEEELDARTISLHSIPNEILLQIFSYVSAHDLASLSCTCLLLYALSNAPSLWASLVSSFRITSPAPYPSFKALYVALRPHLWLGSRLWHSDRRFTGHLAISHYSAESGSITLHTLLLTHSHGGLIPSSFDPNTLIAPFSPVLKLWKTPPLLTLPLPAVTAESPILTTVQRALAIPPDLQTHSMSLWPPRSIPARERARNMSHNGFQGASHVPPAGGAADSIFRLRRELGFQSAAAGGETETFAAVDTALYTPDDVHALRGLWVGDYAIHGCEVVLFHQEAHRLSAIKLTGDMNVPRGELTFRVPDLRNVVRVGDEGWEWPGAKVVQARGHIASANFRQPCYIHGEFIWISNDEVAFHWMLPVDESSLHGIICRFRRLDIDRLIFGDGMQNFANEG